MSDNPDKSRMNLSQSDQGQKNQLPSAQMQTQQPQQHVISLKNSINNDSQLNLPNNQQLQLLSLEIDHNNQVCMFYEFNP